jgi:hypothetical protein
MDQQIIHYEKWLILVMSKFTSLRKNSANCPNLYGYAGLQQSQLPFGLHILPKKKFTCASALNFLAECN